MKFLLYFTFLICPILTIGQSTSHIEKYSALEPDVWMKTWDKKNSSPSITIDTLRYDDIPKYLDFKGTVVEALQWKDKLGSHILLQTVTGHFLRKEFNDNNKKDFTLEDKSELYCYLFTKTDTDLEYKRKWRIYDFNDCFGVDWFTGFIPSATTITDINNNGIAEVTIPYVIICRGGMDPGSMKIISYEDTTKYVLRGSTMLMCDSKTPYGGEFTESENLKNNRPLSSFLKAHWERNKCENGKYY